MDNQVVTLILGSFTIVAGSVIGMIKLKTKPPAESPLMATLVESNKVLVGVQYQNTAILKSMKETIVGSHNKLSSLLSVAEKIDNKTTDTGYDVDKIKDISIEIKTKIGA